MVGYIGYKSEYDLANGGIVGPENNTSDTLVSGMWSLEEQYSALKNNSWPILPIQGTQYYLIQNAGTNVLEQYKLTDPFNLDTRSLEHSLTTPTSRLDNIDISIDGTKLHVASTNADALRYTLAEPFNLSTASLDYTVAGLFSNREANCFEIVNGNIFYQNDGNGNLLQFSLSTPYDIRTRTQTGSLGGFSASGPGDPAFSPDGTKVVIGARGRSYIIGGTCSTPFDISTFSQQNSFTLSDADPACCKWNEDGTKLFTRHASPNMVNELTATTPYSLSGMSFTRQVFDNPGYAAGGHDFNYHI